MRRVLFVDDEQRVLDGLRDLLRKQRKQWEMVFALGGQAALAELAKATFDVIVSDMRMPEINGAQLLQTVKEEHPRTARIILSGYAEREAVVDALPVAHQFLSKPCDAELLRNVVERACGLQALLQDESVQAVIGKVDRLPSVPRTYWQLTQAAAQPDVRLADLASIVEQDAPMAAKILQLVNSSFFGVAQRQTSVQQAVVYLGTELLKALALTAHVFVTAGTPRVAVFSLDALQEHSVLVARVAKRFFSDRKRSNEAFTAALVHDVGKIVLAMAVPARFASAMRDARETGRPLHGVERDHLGVAHAEVGAYLLGLWGLPLSIVEAVAHHHTPQLVGEMAGETLVATHVADALVAPATAELDAGSESMLDVAFVDRAGFGGELLRWRAVAEEELAAANRSAGKQP
ncbi:MAG: HDOD domain-containing protein [Candidatus Schekmanbacteria bacterium]|nr:HDOD domain-containing protein [Candidatus Schekmanbacteria bacterium]